MPTLQSDAHERLMRRIKGLLALSESPNENEAAAAAEMASKLMLEYNIQMADIGDKEYIDIPYGMKSVRLQGIIKTAWVVRLASAVAAANLCEAWFGKHSVSFVGREDNIATAEYVMNNLHIQLVNMVRDRVKEHTRTVKAAGYSAIGGVNDHQVYRRSWLVGAVSTIADALYSQIKIFKSTLKGTELVSYNDSQIALFVKENLGHTRSFEVGSSSLDIDGYRKGKEDGHFIAAQPAVNSNASSVKRLS